MSEFEEVKTFRGEKEMIVIVVNYLVCVISTYKNVYYLFNVYVIIVPRFQPQRSFRLKSTGHADQETRPTTRHSSSFSDLVGNFVKKKLFIAYNAAVHANETCQLDLKTIRINCAFIAFLFPCLLELRNDFEHDTESHCVRESRKRARRCENGKREETNFEGRHY